MHRFPFLGSLLPGLCIALVAAQALAGVPGEFDQTASMTVPRVDHTATLLPNGQVLAAGGDADPAELYNPENGAWTATGALNQPRHEHTATLLPNGKVLVAGGAFGAFSMQPRNSAELYDPSAGTWTFTGSSAGGGDGIDTSSRPDGSRNRRSEARR